MSNVIILFVFCCLFRCFHVILMNLCYNFISTQIHCGIKPPFTTRYLMANTRVPHRSSRIQLKHKNRLAPKLMHLSTISLCSFTPRLGGESVPFSFDLVWLKTDVSFRCRESSRQCALRFSLCLFWGIILRVDWPRILVSYRIRRAEFNKKLQRSYLVWLAHLLMAAHPQELS